MNKLPPPQEFINDMNRWGKDVPGRNWRNLPEWRIWASGYNAGVRMAKAILCTTLATYDIRNPVN